MQQEQVARRTKAVIAAIAAVMIVNYLIRLVPVSLVVSNDACLSLTGGMTPAKALSLCAWAEFMMVSLGAVVLTALVILFVLGRDLLHRVLRGRETNTMTPGIVTVLFFGWIAASFLPMGPWLGDVQDVIGGTRAEGLALPVLLGGMHLLQLGVLGYSVLHLLEPAKMRRIHDAHCAVRYRT